MGIKQLTGAVAAVRAARSDVSAAATLKQAQNLIASAQDDSASMILSLRWGPFARTAKRADNSASKAAELLNNLASGSVRATPAEQSVARDAAALVEQGRELLHGTHFSSIRFEKAVHRLNAR